MCEICSKLTIKTPEQRNYVILVSLLFILDRFNIIALVFPLLILIKQKPVGLTQTKIQINSNVFLFVKGLKFLFT